MKKLLVILIGLVMTVTASAQIIYAYPDKTSVHADDKVLGTDQLTLQTVNFPISAISNYVLNKTDTLKVLPKSVTKLAATPIEDVINALPEFTVGKTDFLIVSATISDLSGTVYSYISTKGPGNYGAGRTPFTSADLIPIVANTSAANVVVAGGLTGWIPSTNISLDAALTEAAGNTVKTTGIQSISGDKTFISNTTVSADLYINGDSDGAYLYFRHDNSVLDSYLQVDPFDGTLYYRDGTYNKSGELLNEANLTGGANILMTPTSTGVEVSVTGNVPTTEYAVGITNDYGEIGVGNGDSQGDFNEAMYGSVHGVNVPRVIWIGQTSGNGSGFAFQRGIITCTVARLSTGWYRVTHNLNTLNYVALVSNPNLNVVAGANNQNLNYFDVNIMSFTPVPEDADFTVTITK